MYSFHSYSPFLFPFVFCLLTPPLPIAAMYRTIAYGLAWVIMEIPNVTVGAIMFGVPFYWMAGFRDSTYTTWCLIGVSNGVCVVKWCVYCQVVCVYLVCQWCVFLVCRMVWNKTHADACKNIHTYVFLIFFLSSSCWGVLILYALHYAAGTFCKRVCANDRRLLV